MAHCSRRILLVFVFLALALACGFPVAPVRAANEEVLTTAPLPAVGAPEIRALYVGAPGAATRSAAGCIEMIQRARENHVTDVFIEVMVSGFAWYRSDKLPGFVAPRGEFVDVLQVALNEAHNERKGRVRIHAVVAPTLALDGRFPYEAPEFHVSRVHPDWMCRDRNGRRTDHDGVAWLDPTLPEVARHTRDTLAELLKRYDVDGVCFSGIRYPETNLAWGYGTESLALYRTEKDLKKDQTPAPDDADWTAWRAARVSDLLQTLRDTVRRSERSQAAVSIAAIATGAPPAADSNAKPDFQGALQYWPVWMREGTVDWVLLEDFHAHHMDDGAFLKWVDYARAQPREGRLIVAVAGSRNFDSGVAMQMRLAISRGVDGLILHTYDRPALNVSPTADILGYIGKTLYSPDYVLPSYFREAMFEQSPPVRSFPPIVGVDDLPQPVPIKPVKVVAPKPVKSMPPKLSQKDASLALIGNMDPQRRAAIEAYRQSANGDARIRDFRPLPPEPELDFLDAPWVEVFLDHGIQFTARHLASDADSMRFRTKRRGVELTIPRHLVRRVRPISDEKQDDKQ